MNANATQPKFDPLDFNSPRSISPTDIGAYQRLEGCERFLRLRLHTTNVEKSWLEKMALSKQTIPLLLTESGRDFESEVEAKMTSPAIRSAQSKTQSWVSQNGGVSLSSGDRVVKAAGALSSGESLTLFQAGLEVEIGNWKLQGVLDVLRLTRTSDGKLQIMIADMKASQRAKVEHRLQLAFYYRMVESLFGEAQVPLEKIEFGVLYRGPQNISEAAPQDQEKLQEHRDAAKQEWGVDDYYFELCEDTPTYLNNLDKLVFNPDSQARRIADKDFENLAFHLSSKCDACVFSEFCLKSSAETRDLSLLPYLTLIEKMSLHKHGIKTIDELAALKKIRATAAAPGDPHGWNELETPLHQKDKVAQLAGSRDIGSRLDELIHRAHAFCKTSGFKSYIPSKGEGTLPYVSPEVNANIVRIYLDGGLDYINNRAYLLGALFVGYKEGNEQTRRSVVSITPQAPTDAKIERDLIEDFLSKALSVAIEMAHEAQYIDANGELIFKAPIHITFFDQRSQKIWLETLSRHIPAVMAGAPIFDFLKQLPSGDSFVTSTLHTEARQLKNFPLTAPSLQVLARYLQFDWGTCAKTFRRGLFDDSRLLDDKITWYTARSRFSSQIPLEYAYGAWDLLPLPNGNDDLFEGFRGLTTKQIEDFCGRRLQAIEHIASRFKGNTKTTIQPYDLNVLENFAIKDPTFADALQTFLQLERLAELGEWKSARHAPPERRMLSGDTLIVRYWDEDQQDASRTQNRINREILTAREEFKANYKANNAGKVKYPPELSTKPVSFDFLIRLRVDGSGCDCSLQDALAQGTWSEGDSVWLLERDTVDSRLPVGKQIKFHPTVRQLLTWSKNARILHKPYEENGTVFIDVCPESARGGDGHSFTFGGQNCYFDDGETYTLDPNPNAWTGSTCFKKIEEIQGGEQNFVYDLLQGIMPSPQWPQEAQIGQRLFLVGLTELAVRDSQFAFEESKRKYIGENSAVPLLLVQGPPGTGKTYATAFALLARIQGAMAAGLDSRVLITSHTHAAVNVALRDVHEVIEKLRNVQTQHPQIFKQYFDERLLNIPLFRLQGTSTDFNEHSYLIPLWCDKTTAEEYGSGDQPFLNPRQTLLAEAYCVAGAVPTGVRKVWDKDSKSGKPPYFNVLVVDEASQMNQPLSCVAAVAHQSNSSMIVVGDPRQMPPITKHEWHNENHRVFEGQPAFHSLYEAVAALNPPTIKFEESFRLHKRMAEFLRDAIYAEDKINYRSNRTKELPDLSADLQNDPFLSAVFAPGHPMILIEHDEDASILENGRESDILRPILEVLVENYQLNAKDGLGIVVPHRAQRALLQDTRWKVETTEKYQGDQRQVMAFSATESDVQYLLQNGSFLFDPRRLCVSLSRAKEKLILVAAKSVFDTVPLDEETFLHAQLWQKLRDGYCTHILWGGTIAGAKVTVRGSGL